MRTAPKAILEMPIHSTAKDNTEDVMGLHSDPESALRSVFTTSAWARALTSDGNEIRKMVVTSDGGYDEDIGWLRTIPLVVGGCGRQTGNGAPALFLTSRQG